MKSFVMLLRREFWENRGAFLTTPLAVGGIMVSLSILAISAAATLVNEVDGERFLLSKAVAELQNITPTNLEDGLNGALIAVAGLFNLVLFFVVFFYLLGSLYDDRKDRSMLFWKSLPISDTRTVMSKLAAAALLAPALYVAVIAVTQLAFMVIATFLVWNADLSAWDYVWGPAQPIKIWALLAAAYVTHAFWMLPIWGWLLLASAFARSKPFLWAVVPPLMLIIFQQWLNMTKYFRFDNQVAELIGERLLGGVLPMSMQIDNDGVRIGTANFADGDVEKIPLTFALLTDRFRDPDLWWGLVFGAVLIVAAIYIRRFRDET